METYQITFYSTIPHPLSPSAFEEAYYHSRLRYSLRHLMIIDNISEQLIQEALQKSLEVCCLLGIKSERHFKKIYVFDAMVGSLQADWIMSRNGFNLMVMQIPSINPEIAQWLWELAGP